MTVQETFGGMLTRVRTERDYWKQLSERRNEAAIFYAGEAGRLKEENKQLRESLSFFTLNEDNEYKKERD